MARVATVDASNRPALRRAETHGRRYGAAAIDLLASLCTLCQGNKQRYRSITTLIDTAAGSRQSFEVYPTAFADGHNPFDPLTIKGDLGLQHAYEAMWFLSDFVSVSRSNQ